MKRVGTIMLALCLPLVTGAGRLRSIPAAFVGDWASSAEQCLPNPTDNANIRIAANKIQDFEARLEVQYVVKQGKAYFVSGRRITADYEPSEFATRLELLENGTVLRVGDEEDTSHYVRCRR